MVTAPASVAANDFVVKWAQAGHIPRSIPPATCKAGAGCA